MEVTEMSKRIYLTLLSLCIVLWALCRVASADGPGTSPRVAVRPEAGVWRIVARDMATGDNGRAALVYWDGRSQQDCRRQRRAMLVSGRYYQIRLCLPLARGSGGAR